VWIIVNCLRVVKCVLWNVFVFFNFHLEVIEFLLQLLADSSWLSHVVSNSWTWYYFCVVTLTPNSLFLTWQNWRLDSKWSVSWFFLWILLCWCSWLRGLLFQICIRTLINHFLRRKLHLYYPVSTEPVGFILGKCCLIWVGGCCRIKIMYNHFNEKSGLKAPLIADDVYEIIMKVFTQFKYYPF
jgi:hypothetical protein